MWVEKGRGLTLFLSKEDGRKDESVKSAAGVSKYITWRNNQFYDDLRLDESDMHIIQFR